MSSPSLFSPLQLGRYELTHRVVMAPLTRMRAGPGRVPGALAPTYYGQRASAGGLIVTEGSQVTPFGQGVPDSPGIYSAEQVEGWKKVTEAVHAREGRIFLQLWHVGRSSHSSLLPDGALPVGPSAIPITSLTALNAGWEKVPYETPRALAADEIPGVIEAYREGARNALAAGFDGVEIHGANGYLLDQFLHDQSNQRTDLYGGSIEKRARLLIEVTTAAIEVWGADRVGVRLSPGGTFNDMADSDPIALYSHVLARLDALEIAYLHLIQARDGAGMEQAPVTNGRLRPLWRRPLILAGGFTGASADEAVRSGQADAVAFGRHFIANPDLPLRLKLDAPLNPYERSTFYGGGAEGYVDYPRLERVAQALTKEPLTLNETYKEHQA